MSNIEGEGSLPSFKKPLKFTPVSIRIMESCLKAYNAQKFLLLYFSNRKTFVKQFFDPKFAETVSPKFEFIHLSRSDKSGNWLTTTYQFKSSPFYSIIDSSNGAFVRIHYGDMTLPELQIFINSFLSSNPKFILDACTFPAIINGIKENKKRTSYSYGTKIKVMFQSTRLPLIHIFVNKTAPLSCAFESYCKKQNVDQKLYYFMYHGVQLPPEMTALQFHIKSNNTIIVHHLDDKNSNEPITVSIIGVDGSSTALTVQKCRTIGAALRAYCESQSIDPLTIRYRINNDFLDENLTFGEHDIKNGDQIIIQQRMPLSNILQNRNCNLQQDLSGTPSMPNVLEIQQNPNMVYIPLPPFTHVNSPHVLTKSYQYQKQPEQQNTNLWDNFQ